MTVTPLLAPPPGSRIAICGGCGGLGQALVAAAAAAGLDVAVLDLSAVLDTHPLPGGVRAVPCDATDEGSVQAAFADLAGHWGAIDAVVNLVGFANQPRTVETLTSAEWDEIIGGNLRSTFLVSRAAIPLLRAGNAPALVNTSSTFGVMVPFSGYGPYATSKAAIINLTRVLAIECAPAIRVNAIAPGFVKTPFVSGGTGRNTKREPVDEDALARMVPLGRNAVPADIAGPLLFLIGPAAGFITGQTLHVNGGVWS